MVDYGNRIGVPDVGGEVWFDESFTRNPIVLATCVGVATANTLPRGGVVPGDLILVVGNATDRSGLRGSAFASRGLDASREELDLSAVQVGNPLLEKLLIDAFVEVFESGLAKYVKDLGGGGLAVALVESARDLGLGVEAWLDRLHLADPTMGPVEVLVSETQERMMLVVSPSDLDRVAEVFRRYELGFSVVGRFIAEPRFVAYWRGEKVVDLPVDLAAGAPEIEWPMSEPGYIREVREVPALPMPDLREALLRVLSSPNVASKEPVYSLYDFDVGVRTVLKPGEGDAAVLRVWEAGEGFGIAVKGDSNPRYAWLDPFLGAANSLVKAFRNVAVVGAEPVAAVDSINVGSPEKPDRYWQFVNAVKGLAWAAEGLGIPIVGGKVSFYNEDESSGRAVKPTVAVVVLGVVRDVSRVLRMGLVDGGEVVVVGVTRPELGGSEYLASVHGLVRGVPPSVDFGVERRVAGFMVELAGRGLALAAHDVGVGGLGAALAKMAVAGGVGFDVDVCSVPRAGDMRVDELLFSESNGRVVVVARDGRAVVELAAGFGLEARVVGVAGGDRLVYRCGGDVVTSVSLGEASEAYNSALSWI